jgi:hypothetical protein
MRTAVRATTVEQLDRYIIRLFRNVMVSASHNLHRLGPSVEPLPRSARDYSIRAPIPTGERTILGKHSKQLHTAPYSRFRIYGPISPYKVTDSGVSYTFFSGTPVFKRPGPEYCPK